MNKNDFSSMTLSEQREVAELFGTWLRRYTHKVIKSVMEQADEILNNEYAMKLLRELHERETKERSEFTDSMRSMLVDFDTFGEYDPHNHCLTHSDSYRDVLYDMYIK